MSEPLPDETLDGIRKSAESHVWELSVEDAVQALLGEIQRLKAYSAALERTENGRTGPFRLGSLAALLCSLIQGRYAENSECPKASTRILRDVADIYRGLVEASGSDASKYFPNLPPLSSDEAESLWKECLSEAKANP